MFLCVTSLLSHSGADSSVSYVCCFSRCLTYAIKWACSAVARMVICRDNNKVFLLGGARRNSMTYEDASSRIYFNERKKFAFALVFKTVLILKGSFDTRAVLNSLSKSYWCCIKTIDLKSRHFFNVL